MAETRERENRKYWRRIGLISRVLLVILITCVTPGLFVNTLYAVVNLTLNPSEVYQSWEVLINRDEIFWWIFIVGPVACVFIPAIYLLAKKPLSFLCYLAILTPSFLFLPLFAFLHLLPVSTGNPSDIEFFPPSICGLLVGATVAYADISRGWRKKEAE